MFEPTEVYGVFVRVLGLVFAFQLGSTGHQLLPLIGSRGIEPVAHLLAAFRRDHGAVRGFFKLPTLFWLSCSDVMIVWLPRGGALLGLALAAGILGEYSWCGFLGCWLIWLSIINANSNLFGIPWDNLLLEAGLWAIFLPGFHSAWDLGIISMPHPLVHFGIVFILFRVMFGMGLTKFKAVDHRTRDGSFVYYFLEWQPFGTAQAFYLRSLPMVVHRGLLAFLFFSEMVAPWFGFLGPEGRLIFALSTVALQVGIQVCGNFGIFNVMPTVLTLPLLADMPLWVIPELSLSSVVFGALILGSFPYVFLLDSWNQGLWTFVPSKLESYSRLLTKIADVYRLFVPFRIWAAYGIFTPKSNYPKIFPVIQMTVDGKAWYDVTPRYLSYDPGKNASHFAPYHPRLDHFFYYYWFRKGDFKLPCLTGTNPYYVNHVGIVEKLVEHLYRGNPVVQSIFAHVPFDRPTGIRMGTYAFKMHSPSELRETQHYWRRELMGTNRPMERIELNDTTGIHPVYSPYVFDTLTRDSDGVAVYQLEGVSIPMQTNPIICFEKPDDSEEFRNFKYPTHEYDAV